MKKRFKSFSLRSIHLTDRLKKTQYYKVISYQLIKSATSSAANYNAIIRSRSRKEFYAKLCITIEELDESIFWLELILDLENSDSCELLESLINEGTELLKILSSSRKNTY